MRSTRAAPGGTALGGRLAAAMALTLATSTTASAETLQQALARTYRSNPQLAAERARQRADDETVPRALAGFRPSVVATVGAGPAFERDRPGGTSFTSAITPGLTINQNIYDGGRTAASVRSAESAVFAGRETLRGVEQTVLAQAATAYMDVLRDTARVELQRGNIGSLRETLRIARKRYETGDASATDPAQAESRLARAEADLALAESDLAASRSVYRQVVGAEPVGLDVPRSPEGLLPSSVRAAILAALDHHPAVRGAQHAVDAAASDVRVAGADLLPSVTVQGSLSRVFGGALDTTGAVPASAGLQASVPIYDGGLASAQVRQAKETLAQRRIELASVRDRVRADIRSSWGALEAARAAVPASEAAVAANELALAGVRREQMTGRRTTLDVLNAQQELVNARTTLLVAQRDRVVASYAVLAATGDLNAARLGLGGARYRPETHYRQVRDLPAGSRTPDGR